MPPSALAKFRRYQLFDPCRLYRAARLRLGRNVSVDLADALGLLERPARMQKQWIFSTERASIEGAIAPQAHRHLEENKLVFAGRAVGAGLPLPQTLCVLGNSADCDPRWQGPLVADGDALARFLRELPELDAICKPVEGGQGYDILALRASGGQMLPEGAIRTPGELFAHLAARGYRKTCWIVQQRVQTDPALRPLMPGPGLGTVRIHSALARDGSVVLRWPLLKLPGAGALTDNWHLGQGGGLVAPVDPASGVLGAGVGRRAPGRRRELFAVHPASGVPIEGVRLPHWPQLLQLAERAARSFPELPALGWDIALAPAGPVLIEANWSFGLELPQAAWNRGLRAELLEFFRSVL